MLVSHGSAFLKGLVPLYHFIWPRQKFEFYFSSMEGGRIVEDPKEWMNTLILNGVRRLSLVFYHFEELHSREIRFTNSYGIEVEYPTHLELWFRKRFNRKGQSRHFFEAAPVEKSWREKECNLEIISSQLGEAMQKLIDFCHSHAPDWDPGFEQVLRYLISSIPENYKFNNLIPSEVYPQGAKKLLLASLSAQNPVGEEIPFGPADYPIFPELEQKQYDALRRESKQIALIGELAAINSIN